MAILKRGKVWYIDYYYKGRRIMERVGKSKRMAQLALEARKGEIAQGRFKLEQVRSSPRFEDFCDEYLEWAKVNHRAWRTHDMGHLKPVMAYFQERRLGEITTWLIEKYKAMRLEKVRPATVNRELTVLSSIFSRAVEWGRLERHPMKGGQVRWFREVGAIERVLDYKEEEVILKESPVWLQDLLVVALDTGMRLGELAGLKAVDIDLPRGFVTVRGTKNGRDRRIPLTTRAREAFSRRLREVSPDGLLFYGGPGERPWRIDSAFRRACARAGIKGLRFHDLRHTFATRLVQRGIDLITVQRLLGHSDLRMVQRYAHPGEGEARRAIFLLDINARDGSKMEAKGKSVGKISALNI